MTADDRQSPEEQRPSEAPPETPLQRQRRRPMWGCVRTLFFFGIGTIVLIAVILIGIYSYLGTSNFAEFVRLRIERNLESHLGRDVSIARVVIDRRYPTRILIDDLRIANAPGATRPYFATVRQVEIVGGLDSFWNRVIRLGRVEVRDARINFEVFPEGYALEHNFPKWTRSKPRKYEITRLEISKMYVTGGAFEMNDRRHEIYALTSGLKSEITPTFRKSIYEGVATGGSILLRIQDYEPVTMDLRGGFYYRPGSLALRSIALRGRGIEAFVSGKIDPLTDAVYDLRVAMRSELARVREVFRVENRLGGTLSLDGNLRGRQGTFSLDAGFRIPELEADAYDLADVRGRMTITDQTTRIQVASAGYGGGKLTADYRLAKYAEPYPMTVDLRYNGVSLEKLFADWELAETGLRGSARGRLTYRWNKDDILGGSGEGTAKLLPGAVAFGNARYPVKVGGETEFSLDAGTIRFAPSTLETPASKVAFSGPLKIEGLIADLALQVESRDFAELDKVAFNFALATGEKDYELLGLGGAGSMRASVRGPLDEPMVLATVTGTSIAFNNIVLGDGELELRYDGPAAMLTFDRSLLHLDGGTIAMTGTVAFPESGEGPLLDLTFVADGYDVARAISVVELELVVSGTGTGRLRVVGTPDAGRVFFEPLVIARDGTRLRLEGMVAWAPGEKNITYDLNIAAESFPVGEILAFLDMASVPMSGAVTGTLHLEGPQAKLEGAGSVTLRAGTLFGEDIETATADLVFTQGSLRVPHLEATGPAGKIVAEAEVDLNTERFTYVIRSAEIDPSRVKALAGLQGLFGGRLTITSSGGGTFTQPELELEARLDSPTIRGLELPEGVEPPRLFITIRNGQLIVRGAAFDVVTIEGSGSVAPDGAVDGLVQLVISDVARLLSFVAPGNSIALAGNTAIDLRLGGKISPIEALVVEGTIPVFNLTINEHPLTPPSPARFAFRNGRIVFDSSALATNQSSFVISGSVGVTGARTIDLQLNGTLEAAMAQLFVPDMRAEGVVRVAAEVTGTLADPRINGTVEVDDGELRIAGFPQLIDDIRASLSFAGQRIELENFSATVGGGRLVAGGTIYLDGLTLSRFSLGIRTVEQSVVALRYFEGVTLEGSLDLRLEGDVERALLRGNVVLARGLYYKNFDFGASLLNLVLERRTVVAEVAAPWQDRISLDVKIRAQNALAVRNNIADLTASADLDLRGTLASPVILGLVTIDDDGTVKLQDIEYRITRGTIDFANPFRIDPYFDITAEGRRGEYDLTINLTGTLDRIEPSITSDPPASDLTLLSLFTSDMPVAGPEGFQQNDLRTAGAELLIQSVGGLIGSRILPFADTIRIDPGLTDETGTQVTFEKQISDEVRAIIIYNTTNHNNREIVEWQVTPEWFLTFTRDDETGEAILINAVEARFRRRYEGRW